METDEESDLDISDGFVHLGQPFLHYGMKIERSTKKPLEAIRPTKQIDDSFTHIVTPTC
jgi:hypothetical protein